MGQDLCADLLNDYFFEKIEKPFQRMRENFDRDLKTSSFHIDIFFVNLKFQTKHYTGIWYINPATPSSFPRKDSI